MLSVDPRYDTPNLIALYVNCGKCVAELPPGKSMQTWSRTQLGLSADGRQMQLWCQRHQMNVGVWSNPGAILLDTLREKILAFQDAAGATEDLGAEWMPGENVDLDDLMHAVFLAAVELVDYH